MSAQMVREVASKTSNTAGDGTATVLAQAILREGIKMVVAGAKTLAIKLENIKIEDPDKAKRVTIDRGQHDHR